MKIPVGKTIAYAYSFTFGQLGTIIGLCWLPLVLMAVLQFLPYAFGGNPMASENATAAGRQGLENLVSSLLMLLLYSIMYVPVARQALGLRQGSALVHFALGPPEFRVFGAMLLFFLLLMAMAMGIGILVLLLGGLTALTGKNPIVAIAGALAMIAAMLGFIYALVRLAFLIVPVTVAEGHVSLIRGWLLARGNFWRIFGVMLAVLLPVYLLHLIGLIVIAGPGLVAPLPADAAAAEQALSTRFALVGQHMPAYLGLILILAPFDIGLGIGASAFAYRALVPPNGVNATAA
jgi:hypothetical protein